MTPTNTPAGRRSRRSPTSPRGSRRGAGRRWPRRCPTGSASSGWPSRAAEWVRAVPGGGGSSSPTSSRSARTRASSRRPRPRAASRPTRAPRGCATRRRPPSKGVLIEVDDPALAEGVDRLVVLGVDWTQSPEQAATTLGTLLEAQAYTGHLGFVAQGTPTNNTSENRAGFTSDSERRGGRRWTLPGRSPRPTSGAPAAAGGRPRDGSRLPSTTSRVPRTRARVGIRADRRAVAQHGRLLPDRHAGPVGRRPPGRREPARVHPPQRVRRRPAADAARRLPSRTACCRSSRSTAVRTRGGPGRGPGAPGGDPDAPARRAGRSPTYRTCAGRARTRTSTPCSSRCCSARRCRGPSASDRSPARSSATTRASAGTWSTPGSGPGPRRCGWDSASSGPPGSTSSPTPRTTRCGCRWSPSRARTNPTGYLTEIADLLSDPNGRTALNLRENSIALLEALAACGAVMEIDRTGLKTIRDVVAMSTSRSWPRSPRCASSPCRRRTWCASRSLRRSPDRPSTSSPAASSPTPSCRRSTRAGRSARS